MMETRTELTCAAKRIGQASNVDVYLSCMPPFVENAQSLVRCVHEISQAGHPGIGFRHYGVIPQPCFDWVRQAVRFARRESK